MKTKYNSKVKLVWLLFLLTALAIILTIIIVILNKEKNIIDFESSFLGILGAVIGMLLGVFLSTSLLKSKKTRIFLSYNLNDKILADKIAEDLQNNGLSILRESQIKPGENLRDVTEKYLNNCDLMYVILSNNTYKSKFLKEEILYAKKKKIPVIPIVTDESELPNFLSNYKIADFRTNYDEALKEIIPTK